MGGDGFEWRSSMKVNFSDCGDEGGGPCKGGDVVGV